MACCRGKKSDVALQSTSRKSVPIIEEEDEENEEKLEGSRSGATRTAAPQNTVARAPSPSSKPATNVAPKLPSIRLGASVPPSSQFRPAQSEPRPPGSHPFKRMVLISSRVHDYVRVAAAVLPGTALCLYDWHGSLADLQQRVQTLMPQGSSILSIAIVAPGDDPACADLVEGCAVTNKSLGDAASRLREKALNFLRYLAGLVAPDSSTPDGGRRIDLIGCRLADAPLEGAALLKNLWRLCGVPFASADGMLRSYALSTWRDSPKTGTLSLVTSTIGAADLYFDRAKLDAEPSAAASGAVSAPSSRSRPNPRAAQVPAGAQSASRPTRGSSNGASEEGGTRKAGRRSVADASAAAAADEPPHKDIFLRFKRRVRDMQLPLPEIFEQYDVSKTGTLNNQEVAALVSAVCPDATPEDVVHINAMMDLDGDQRVTLEEFQASIDKGAKVSTAVQQCQDETDVVRALEDYFVQNEDVVRKHFKNDKEITQQDLNKIVANIIQDKDERQFVMTYLYQMDDGDGLHTYDSVLKSLRAFGTPYMLSKVQQPPPARSTAATAGLAAAPLRQRPPQDSATGI